MTAYSSDLRECVLADRDGGMATGDVADTYRVSPFWVRRLKQRRCETGSCTAKARRHGPEPTRADHADRIAAAVHLGPDGTIGEHRQWLRPGLSAPRRSWLSPSSRRVDGKSDPEEAAEQDRPDLAPPGLDSRGAVRGSPELDPESLVFVDATWASTNMTGRRGRSPVGVRLVMPVPHGHRRTTTFVAVLRVTDLVAPLVVGGAIKGELFEAYVRQQSAPALRPGDAVVDNLGRHERAWVCQAIETAGCRLLYSPDLNPIEQAFAKLKALLGRVAERTVECPWRILGGLLDELTPVECRNFSHYEYPATPT